MAAAAVVLAALVFLLLPGFLGRLAERNLEAQNRLLAQSSLLEVVSHQYERGWFTSTETTVVRLKPQFFGQLPKAMPAPLKVLLENPITLVGHVRHGLFAGSLRPVTALETVEFRYSPEAQKTLKQFFGDKTPVTMTNRIGLTRQSGVLQVRIADFNYQELSGIKIDWKGLDATIDYRDNYASYTTDATVPGIQIVLADKGDTGLEQLHYRAETRQGPSGLSLGKSTLNLAQFHMTWKEGVPYDIQLNQLVNMVTNLQVGAFINPTGSVAPSTVVLKNFSFDTFMDEQQGFINSGGKMKFDELAYGQDLYGPLNLDVSAEHLDAASLAKLKAKMYALAKQNLPEGQMREAVIAAAKSEGLGVFSHNPVLKMNAFDFKTPSGILNMQGMMNFKGITAKDMDTLNAMLAKSHIELNLSVPQAMLEDMGQAQVKSLFAVEQQSGDQPDMKEIQNTARAMVASTINLMQQQGYLKVVNGAVQTKLEVNNNRLLLNGKPYVGTEAASGNGTAANDAPAKAAAPAAASGAARTASGAAASAAAAP